MKEYKRLTEILDIETKEIAYQCDILTILKRLCELEDKLENGTLIELPCKVGDTVYVINGDNKIEKVTVFNYTINKKGFVFEVVEEGILSKYYLFDFDFNDDWFLSKAEAETKLKELQNER